MNNKALKNVAWSSVAYLAGPLMQFILAPFLIAKLGNVEFGIWILINSILAVSGVLNFGLTDATVKYVAEERQRGNAQSIINVVQGTLWSYAILSVVAGTIVQILAPTLVESVFKIPKTESEIAIRSLRVAGWGFQVRMFYSVVESICRGFERYDLESKTQAAVSATGPMLSAVLVYYGGRLSEILIGGIVILFLGSLVLARVVTKMLGSLDWLYPKLDKVTIRRTFSFGFFTWIQGISGMLVQQADKLIVASTIGAEKLTYYSVCVQLAQVAHGLVAKGSSFLFPAICIAKAEGNDSGLRRIFWKGAFLTSMAGTALGLPLAIFSEVFLRLWLGEDAAVQGSTLLAILAFGNALLSTSIIPGYFMNGAGYVRGNTLASSLSGLSIVGSSLLLIPRIGLLGAAWARIMNLPVSFVTRCLVAKAVLKYKYSIYGLITLLPPIVGFTPFLLKKILFPEYSLPKDVMCLALGGILSAACWPLYSRMMTEPWMSNKDPIKD